MLRVAFKRDHLALYYGIKFLYYSKTTWFPRLSLCHRRPSLRVQQLPNLLCDEMIPIIKPGQNAKKAFLNVSTWQNLVSSVTPYLCLPWIFIFHVCGSSPLTSGSNERDVELNIKKSFQRQMPNTHCRPRKSLALLGGPGQRELLCFRGQASSGKRKCFMLSPCTHCAAPSRCHAQWVLNTQAGDQNNDKMIYCTKP